MKKEKVLRLLLLVWLTGSNQGKNPPTASLHPHVSLGQQLGECIRDGRGSCRKIRALRSFHIIHQRVQSPISSSWHHFLQSLR